MKTIGLTFETINNVLVGKLTIDGQCIVPRIDALPADLSPAERRICYEMCYVIIRITMNHNSTEVPNSTSAGPGRGPGW